MGLASRAPNRFLAGIIAVLSLGATAAWAKPAPEEFSKPVKCAEEFQEVGAIIHKARAPEGDSSAVALARDVMPMVMNLRSDGDKANIRSARVDTIELARDTCHEVARNKKTLRMKAYACMGEASLRLADFALNQKDPRPEDAAVAYEDAYCAFVVTVDLAEGSGSDSRSTLADAHEGRALSLLALRTSYPRQRDEFTDLAKKAYQKAIDLEATAGRHFALGRLYIPSNNVKKAEEHILKGADLASTPSDKGEMALALVALSELKRRNGTTAGGIMSLLERARNAAPNSVSANGAIGIAHYELDNKTEARAAFQKVIDSAVNDDVGSGMSRNFRAESYHLMAMLDAELAVKGRFSRDAWEKVVTNAENSVKAGGQEFRYRRLACLAHIARGGTDIRDGDGDEFCNADKTPEGKLLRAMYFMRKAQYVPSFTLRRPPSPREEEWRGYLDDAEQSLISAATTLSSEADNAPAISWPGVAGDATLNKALALGQKVVRRVTTFCRSRLDTSDAESEKSVFESYRVLGCKR